MLPTEIKWVVCEDALAAATELKTTLGNDRYESVKDGLKQFLCGYFSAVTTCDSKQGASISPIRSGIPKAKGLKVRFGYPGCGKSGGLRLAVLAYCEQRLVKITGAWIRREDPDDDEFAESFNAS